MATSCDELINRILGCGDGLADPVAFQDVIDRLTMSGTKLDPVEVTCFGGEADTGLDIRGELRFQSGGKFGEIHRRIYLRRRFVHHELLHIEPAFRGFRLGPVMLLGSLNFYEELELTHIVLQAGLETGKHYWASCGFDFLEEDVRTAIVGWCQVLCAQLGFDDCVGETNRAYGLAALGSPDLDASLAEIEAAIAECEDEIRVLGFDLDDARREGWDLRTTAERNKIAFDEGIPLGKALMLALPCDWKGYLEIEGDSVQKEVFTQSLLNRIESVREKQSE